MNMLSKKSSLLIAVLCSLLISCAGNDGRTMTVPDARLAKGSPYNEAKSDEGGDENIISRQSGYEALTPLAQQRQRINSQLSLSAGFPATGELTLSAEDMELGTFIHTVFGELLNVNYVISNEVAAIKNTVNLQVSSKVNARELFNLSNKLLQDNGVAITERESVYYLHPLDKNNKASVAVGYGRRITDIPMAPGRITQIVPVYYNRDISIERVLRELSNARIEEVQGQSAYSIQGERQDVIRAIELLDILDTPAARGRHIGLLKLTFISVEDFTQKLQELMSSEGLPVDVGKAGNRNMSLIPIEQIGAVAVFAAEAMYIERANFWAERLDVPGQGIEKRYFIYHPRFARASDLGQSVGALLGGVSERSEPVNRARDTQSAFPSDSNSSNVQAGAANSKQPAVSQVRSDDMVMTVDERSNSLIFYSTGQAYQNLLPMIKRLDIMPKQILLEATIAEVTLTDDLALGLEFAIQNGKFGYGNRGAFGINDIGGIGFSFTEIGKNFVAQLRAANTAVNVLSSPSLVVRDGVSANINVGDEVPIVGSTTTNIGTDTQSTTVEYRKTGVKLSVTPTINAQGLVVLEIDQSISNTTEGGTVAGSPAFFERAVKTEVLAQSGQTIMLGGLMSENVNNSQTKVPLLGDLPVLGALFRSDKRSKTKTELIILITPRVLDNADEWQGVHDKLRQHMQLLQIPAENVDRP